jgi:hypothetical protein
MKVGDIIYCKKGIKSNYVFIVDKLYEIKSISNTNKTLFISDENNDIVPFENYYPNDDYYKFNYIFITLKELRKQKLKKLNSL